MAILIIKRQIRFTQFGTWKWKKDNYDRSLTFRLAQAKANIYLEEGHYIKQDLNVLPGGRIEIVYNPAPNNLLKGLKSKGVASREAAQVIYNAYVEAHTKFEALLCSVGRVRNIARMGPESLSNFFSEGSLWGLGVEWKVDDGPFQTFSPKLQKPRGRNPLYAASQLVTPARWQDLQKAADEGNIPDGELLELYWIRSKAGWREIRIAAIEASIISETLLRAYGLEVLKKNGFSNTKLKRLKDELTFNNLLNILLPLSLTKSELRKMQTPIEAVDRLRAIRNDLVHGNIVEKDVDRRAVEDGIDGAIRLVRFLRTKIS